MELVICALEMFIFNVSLLQSVKSLLCKRKINVSVYRTRRTAQFASYLRAFLPFYFNLNGKLTAFNFFFPFRYQQRAASKFEKMAFENMTPVSGTGERDGQTRVSRTVYVFAMD